MRRHIGFLITFFSLASTAFAEGAAPTFKMNGDVTLTSHYVEYGLSESDKSPALQGSFWFNFGPQFRLGLWGSNTNYANSDDHFNLRLNGEVNIPFSATTSAVIAYSQSQYYKAGDHNGNIVGLHLNFGDYRVLYDTMSNWEGTHKSSTRYGFGKLSHLGTWLWNNEAGYNSPTVATVDPYFDFRTGLGYKWGNIFLEGAVTATSAPGSLNGTGDVFFILSASTDF